MRWRGALAVPLALGIGVASAAAVPTTTPTAPPPTTTTAAPTDTTPTATAPPTDTTEDLGTFPVDVGPAPAKRRKAHARPKPKPTAPAAPTPTTTTTGAPSSSAPTPKDPGYAVTQPGPLAPGRSQTSIADFRIPPFLLPIYQAAGVQYGVPWQVLAAINEIETDYGRNDALSSAGAVGWMQFLPTTFSRWGVDASGDGRADPDNPLDAIYSAARYLHAAGADKDLSAAIFAYNHADWYVQSVLLRAQLIGGLPPGVVGSLTGLALGRFPIAASTRYADPGLDPRAGAAGLKHGVSLFADAGSPVLAVQDGRIVALGESPRRGRYVELADADGNRYLYAGLGRISSSYAAVRRSVTLKPLVPRALRPGGSTTPPPSSAPTTPTAGSAPTPSASSAPLRAVKHRSRHRAPSPNARFRAPAAQRRRAARLAPGTDTRFSGHRAAAPTGLRLPHVVVRVPKGPRPQRHYAPVGGAAELHTDDRRRVVAPEATALPAPVGPLEHDALSLLGLTRHQVVARRLRVGSRVAAGTILGQVGEAVDGGSPRIGFAIRPAGRGAPRVDPKPILDGWRLLAATATDRAAGRDPLLAIAPAGGQLLALGRAALGRRVLADSRIRIYACGRRDVEADRIDPRVLATLEFLADSGLDPTVTSLQCGHSDLTTSGNVSEHSTGDAVDIAAINGIPILGHQGPGTITDITIRRLLALTGEMKPHQIISLMTFPGADNTLSLPDHYNHIHVGFHPAGAAGSVPTGDDAPLSAATWARLMNQLAHVPNPSVRRRPSRYSITLGGGD